MPPKPKSELYIKEVEQIINSPITENLAPVRIYASFDEYFKDMTKTLKITIEHKDALKAHFSSLGVLNKQEAWPKALKHYMGEN